ncbi:MAG: DEAD/DEAH box helicase, partial [Campylobacter sp.]|nr:DEAD/DEAH box helicase [Campylobacter sp.]
MQAEVYEYFLENNRDILICENDKEAEICSDAAKFAGFDTFILPDFRAEVGDDLRSYRDELVVISRELSKFYNSKSVKKLIISPFHTILHKLPTKKHLSVKSLEFGQSVDISRLKDEMINFGYEVVDIVEMSGEVSFRGEIIDIFPVANESPFRILLEFDQIESIKEFDPATQLSSSGELERVDITPFIASLNSKEWESVNKKAQNLDTNSLINDINSLGFWVIDGFECYLEKYTSIATNKFDESFEVLPEPVKFRNLNTTFTKELLTFHSDKKIKILARNSSIFESFDLKNSENLTLIKSDLILNLVSKNELIISLNKPISKKRKKRPSIVIDELKEGDFVVHESYGVGKFSGLEKAKVMGAQREFVSILYQGGDKLLLPVENLNMIDRYISSGGVASLDRLGKGSFAKIKEKVRVKLFAIAKEIIDLAAKRSLIEGKKIYYNKEDYAKFVSVAGFEFTDDQEMAISDIRADLASGKVMERLLSGDVGFGKTEVAMNALFWTIRSGYQALFFVPTTLLSSQHYKTLTQRFENFGIAVYRYDRFTPTASKNKLKAELEKGTPLVCIGTHALLNLNAKNIGLVIIDEEHKFGVKQKEKLKNISQNSHILSMSATPIPRSLNMALSTLKGYSTLTTPPKERQDVRTSVKEWDPKLVKEGILRELRRGGQIFYVHNHIANMESIKSKLLEILPNLKILILHSKIDEKTTESEILNFMEGGYDLLLCTSIVESGIHMSNVNTIMIDGSDRFGIA